MNSVQQRFRRELLDEMESQNVPDPADFSLDFRETAVVVELEYEDRPAVTVSSEDFPESPESLAKHLGVLAGE